MKAKRILRTALALVGTAAVVAGGFFLPDIAARAQETDMQAVEVETGAARLFSVSRLSLRERLEWIRGGDVNVELISLEDDGDASDTTQLTRARAAQRAQSIAQAFSAAALGGSALGRMDLTLNYILSPDTGDAFYVWEAYFSLSEDENVYLGLDDETGCLLALSYYGAQARYSDDWATRIQTAADTLAALCADGDGVTLPGEPLALTEELPQEAYIAAYSLYDTARAEAFTVPVYYIPANQVFGFNVVMDYEGELEGATG